MPPGISPVRPRISRKYRQQVITGEKDDTMSNKKQDRVLSVKRFSSFEEENRAEHRRLAALTPNQRLKEFAILQERVWGTKWTGEGIKKTAEVEKVTW